MKITSLGMFLFIKALTATSFAQNMVKGGNPEIFLIIKVADQNDREIVLLFFVIFFIVFNVLRSADE